MDCGENSPESFAFYDPSSSWWRTCRDSWLPLLTKPGHISQLRFPMFLASWPNSGLMHSGIVFRLPTSERHTCESGYSFSPTLRATETDSGGYQRDKGQRGKERLTLKGLVRLLPTLTACETGGGPEPIGPDGRNHRGRSAKLRDLIPTLPSLKASDWKRTGCQSEQTRHSPDLPAVVGGVLNPRWCEWYMGFPVGYCDLPFEDLETL